MMHRRAFTLAELLIVMAVIAVLVTLTTVAISSIAKDARLASAKNSVVAVLDTARGLAMERNTVVLAYFRPRLSGDRQMYVEAVLAEWSGESYKVLGTSDWHIDRFVVIPGFAPRAMPEGIKVAAPRYGESNDTQWVTQTHLPAIDQSNPVGPPNEFPGELIGVMFTPSGQTITRNPFSDADRLWVDLDPLLAGETPTFDWRGNSYDPNDTSLDDPALFFEHYLELDESWIAMAPFVAVYDDDEAREVKTLDWSNPVNQVNELSNYINEFADRVYFNRYTGVVMK